MLCRETIPSRLVIISLTIKTEISLIEGDDYMKPAKSCNCIRCTDCPNYTECIEYEIETEVKKGKVILWRNFLKRLFCKHDYTYTYLHMINGGMAKLYLCECKKCGKVRYKTN